jgi:hypothetical protein
VLRPAGETETMQEYIQDWLHLDGRKPGFQLLVFLEFLNDYSEVIFSISNTYIANNIILCTLLHFPLGVLTSPTV